MDHNEKYYADPDHGRGWAVSPDGTGGIVGVKDIPKGRYLAKKDRPVCSACILESKINKETLAPDAGRLIVKGGHWTPIDPIGMHSDEVARHFAHIGKRRCNEKVGEGSWHKWCKESFAALIKGQTECQYPNSTKIADIYVQPDDTWHEIINTSDPDASKEAFLRQFVRDGNVVYKYPLKGIGDAEKIHAVEQYNSMPMNGKPLADMLMNVRVLYEPKEVNRTGGKGHISIDTTVKTIQIEDKRRCGEECSHFEAYPDDNDQLPIFGGYCKYASMTGARQRVVGDTCALDLFKEKQ